MYHWRVIAIIAALVTLVTAACGGNSGAVDVAREEAEPAAAVQPELTATPTTQPEPTPAPTTRPVPTPALTATLIPEDEDIPRPIGVGFDWNTDFSKHSVRYSRFINSGQSRDSIPPIDEPDFFLVSDVPNYMPPEWPVISLELNGEVKGYPLAILIWHEIVNDDVGGVPVSITYCPLCNTAIVFDRRVDGRVFDFGTSGWLRNSDLVMWDRQTESWWQQITGEAVVGELAGARLAFIPAQVISWNEFRSAFPDGRVLSLRTGFDIKYGGSPYPGYDSPNNIPVLFNGTPDPRLEEMERVVGISIGESSVAYPFTLLKQHPVINDAVNGQDLVVFYDAETQSPFMMIGADDYHAVGSTGVFEPFAEGRKLTFKAEGGVVTDEKTGSTWNILGRAVDGPLTGTQLAPVVHANHFWFAWAAFHSDTAIRAADELE